MTEDERVRKRRKLTSISLTGSAIKQLTLNQRVPGSSPGAPTINPLENNSILLKK